MDAVSHLAHRQNDMLSDNIGMEEAVLLAAPVIVQIEPVNLPVIVFADMIDGVDARVRQSHEMFIDGVRLILVDHGDIDVFFSASHPFSGVDIGERDQVAPIVRILHELRAAHLH